MREVDERGCGGAAQSGVIQVVSLQVGGTRPLQRQAACGGGGDDGRLELGGILGRHHGAGLAARRHGQPNERGRPLVSPERLAVLREPPLDGGAVERDPELIVRGGPVLLHIAARVGDQRRERRIFIGGAASGDFHQNHLHRLLEGRRLGRLRSVGNRSRGLVKFGAGQRTACVGPAQARGAQAQKHSKMQISDANVAVTLCHV